MTRDELKQIDKTACKMFTTFFLLFSMLTLILFLLCPVAGIKAALLIVSILSVLAAGFVIIDHKYRSKP